MLHFISHLYPDLTTHSPPHIGNGEFHGCSHHTIDTNWPGGPTHQRGCRWEWPGYDIWPPGSSRGWRFFSIIIKDIGRGRSTQQEVASFTELTGWNCTTIKVTRYPIDLGWGWCDHLLPCQKNCFFYNKQKSPLLGLSVLKRKQFL